MKKGYGFQNLEQISQDFTNFIKDFTTAAKSDFNLQVGVE